MNRVISIIKEKGIDTKLQDSVNRSVRFCGEEFPQEMIDEATKNILEFEMIRNPELEDAFSEYAYDLAMNNLVKELGIKYNPDSDDTRNHSEHEIHLAVMLAKMLCR